MAKGRAVDRTILAIEAVVGVAVVAAIVGKTYGFSSTLVFILIGGAFAFTGFVLARMLSSLRDPTLEVVGRVANERRTQLEHEKLLLLQGIKELEADAAVGKVDQADYQHLRRTAEDRALQIIRQLEEEESRFLEKAEALVARRLGRPLAQASPAPFAETEAAYLGQSAEERRRRPAFSGLFDDRPVEMALLDGRLSCSACRGSSELDAVFCTACGRPKQAAREAPRLEGTP
jgi:hypothetical protein